MTSGSDHMDMGSVKVLSLRLDDSLRTQLGVLAQIQQRSLTEECRLGLEAWVTTSRSDPKVQARAAGVRNAIEAEAEARRSAIAAVLGNAETPDMPVRVSKQTVVV
jgi:plasmid stability protein